MIFFNFWLQRALQPRIATKWLEIDQINLHVKFLALNVDFNCLSPDHLGSKKPAQSGVKDGNLLSKMVILPL